MSGPVDPVRLAAVVRRLKADFPTYAGRVLKIRDKGGAIVPLTLNRAQFYLHEQIERQRAETGKVRVLGLKGRQQGFSTYVQARFYWRLQLARGLRAFTLSHLAEATANLYGMTRRYYDNTPAWLKPSARKLSETGMFFDRLQSECSVATAGSSGTGRSATAQLLHGSEMAFWPNAIEHMAGIGQIVPNQPGTEIILESTANGVGNVFHGMVEDAMRGRGEYRLVFVPWFWQDEYATEPPAEWQPSIEDREYGEAYGLTAAQLYWRRQKIQTDFRGDEALFDQEYPPTIAAAFRRVVGDVFIPLDVARRARAQLFVEARGAKILGVDPAEYGSDDTVVIGRQGRDASRLYRRWNGRGPMESVAIIANLADQFGPDMINIDVTGGYGSGIADRLKELGYPVQRIGFGEKAIADDKFPRRLDEMWGAMREWLLDTPCKLPDDDGLQIELCGRFYSYDSSRRTVLEAKEAMKKRGLASPDGGDALALTFALPARVRSTAPRLPKYGNPGGVGY